MDIISKEKRSWNMSQIKGKDTKPEVQVRSLLHRMGYRFRIHKQDLPGKPDIVLKKYKTVIFVHGCFWHRHKDCKFAYLPKSREEFWRLKFSKNIARDRKNEEQLEELNWNVLIIWECELRNESRLADRINSVFKLENEFTNKK